LAAGSALYCHKKLDKSVFCGTIGFSLWGFLIMVLFGSANTEATVVAIVCIVFLLLFVVAGVRQIIKDREQ
jgi:hypothetical protein